jgi:CTP:molybdopterin cytidylyltransferase MocA
VWQKSYCHRNATINPDGGRPSQVRNVATSQNQAVTYPDGQPVVAIVLAAGGGTRYAGPSHKLDASLSGIPVVTRSVTVALAARIGPVVVVTADHVTTALPDDVLRVTNPAWADGQATSLRLGIDTAGAMGATRIVVGLGDQPFVTPEAWRRVAEGGATSPIAVATYGVGEAGRRGHPVSLDASVWPLLPTAGDEGARRLVRNRPHLVREIPCQGSPVDIDTLEDLQRWQNNSSTSSR